MVCDRTADLGECIPPVGPRLWWGGDTSWGRRAILVWEWRVNLIGKKWNTGEFSQIRPVVFQRAPIARSVYFPVCATRAPFSYRTSFSASHWRFWRCGMRSPLTPVVASFQLQETISTVSVWQNLRHYWAHITLGCKSLCKFLRQKFVRKRPKSSPFREWKARTLRSTGESVVKIRKKWLTWFLRTVEFVLYCLKKSREIL